MYESINSFSEDEILKFYENISKRVRELRESHKISQLDMALSIDIKSAAFTPTARIINMESTLI